MAAGPMSTLGTMMVDFGRLPPSRKVLSFAVAGLLLAGLYYRFLYAPLAEEEAEAKGAYEASMKAYTTGADSLRKYSELKPEMAKLREELAQDQAALPTEAEVPAFFETLERKVKESGVEISKWTKRAEEPVESFIKVPVEVEITGTFLQIKRFFASLVQRNITPGEGEEHDRIVSIESLVLSQPQVRNREIILSAKFVAVTFRQEEPPPPPAKPGAPPSTAGAPPPLRPRAAGGAAGVSPAPEAVSAGSAAAGSAGAGSAGAGSAGGAGGAAGADRLRKGL